MRLGLGREGLLGEGREDPPPPSPFWTDTSLLSQAIHLCRGDVISAEPSAYDAPLVMSA